MDDFQRLNPLVILDSEGAAEGTKPSEIAQLIQKLFFIVLGFNPLTGFLIL